MPKRVNTCALCGLLLFLLPLLGIMAAGQDPTVYLEIPPTTRYVQHAGFSPYWFLFFSIVNLLFAYLLSVAIYRGRKNRLTMVKNSGGVFPWWGWAGLALCLFFWLMAWQRFPWFELLQPHTFLPIWAGFILAVNALTVKRSGSCLMLRRPLKFAMLFPASALFWWFFEYLNRFVQNWHYTGIEGLGPGEYSYYSSLAFTTVLPGVFSMIDLLRTIPAMGQGLARLRPLRLPYSRAIPLLTLLVASLGLALIGIYPDQLFALLWVSPLLVLLSIQRMFGQPTVLRVLEEGDWRPLVIPALAALICGFFWELWNTFSLARWTYSVPFVQRFHLFEMPILGYGGYLPFGLECLVVGSLVIGAPFDQAEN